MIIWKGLFLCLFETRLKLKSCVIKCCVTNLSLPCRFNCVVNWREKKLTFIQKSIFYSINLSHHIRYPLHDMIIIVSSFHCTSVRYLPIHYFSWKIQYWVINLPPRWRRALSTWILGSSQQPEASLALPQFEVVNSDGFSFELTHWGMKGKRQKKKFWAARDDALQTRQRDGMIRDFQA